MTKIKQIPDDVVPYIIYKDTIWVRRIKGGWALTEDYTGKINLRYALPPLELIDKAVKDAGIKKPKRYRRIALVPFEGSYEAVAGWGITAGQLYKRSWTGDDVRPIMEAENVLGIILEQGDYVCYILAKPQEEHTGKVPHLRSTYRS